MCVGGLGFLGFKSTFGLCLGLSSCAGLGVGLDFAGKQYGFGFSTSFILNSIYARVYPFGEKSRFNMLAGIMLYFDYEFLSLVYAGVGYDLQFKKEFLRFEVSYTHDPLYSTGVFTGTIAIHWDLPSIKNVQYSPSY